MLGLENFSSEKEMFAKYTDVLTGDKFFREMGTKNSRLMKMMVNSIIEYAILTEASSIRVIDSTDEEYITKLLIDAGELLKLNQDNFPGSYLYRSPPFDVARSEKDTYICTTKNRSGPTNNYLEPGKAMEIAAENLRGSMRGKVLYVVPYWLGPLGSKYGDGGIQLTDSAYVVLNLIKITRVGINSVASLAMKNSFVLALHSTADLNPEKRYIMHFPEENNGMGMVVSFNTNYGGNALLSKKCHALRIASFKAKKEGWMAEHMMLIGVKDPMGKTTYISGAFPSSSGKTNLSMLNPPEKYSSRGWETSLISDDITWMNVKDGHLVGINPEYGFFGVLPHTSHKTNPRAMDAIASDTIFTNAAIDENGNPQWEGSGSKPDNIIDWQGRKYDGTHPMAHPNSRFTTPIRQFEYLSEEYENPEGAVVSAFLFGGRRSDLLPLVMEAKSWQEGVLYGAMQRVETTAAAIGKVGELRNDPMAMRPFMPYDFGDYFQHYLDMGKKLTSPPRIYNINWFRKNSEGKFIWPGYGENMHVLEWIIARVSGKITSAVDTPMGYLPRVSDLDCSDIISDENLQEILKIDAAGFIKEFDVQEPFFKSFGDSFPDELWKTFYHVRERLEKQL
ncbi:MAG: phosphoenolpyruvate carboxykinase (GTP) [Cuniculiplasma sp.]